MALMVDIAQMLPALGFAICLVIFLYLTLLVQLVENGLYKKYLSKSNQLQKFSDWKERRYIK